MLKILRPVAVALCAFLGAVSLPACDNGGMEEVGEDLDEAGEDIKEGVDDIGD